MKKIKKNRIYYPILCALRRYTMMIGMNIIPFSSMRIFLMRLCGVTIGKRCYVGFNFVFDTNFPEIITIGNGVTISHNVSIYTHTGTSVNSRLASVYCVNKPVIIKDGAWISANSILLPGVEIGNDCLIGAGAVVIGATDPCSLYAGNPARKIKSIEFDGEVN